MVACTFAVRYFSAVSRLRRPFLSDRFFFVTVRRRKERAPLVDADLHLLALAFCRARVMHPFYLTAWVFLPDYWHALCAPKHPLAIAWVMKSIKTSSKNLMNRRRASTNSAKKKTLADRRSDRPGFKVRQAVQLEEELQAELHDARTPSTADLPVIEIVLDSAAGRSRGGVATASGVD